MKNTEQVVLWHNECIERLTNDNLLYSFQFLQGVVATLRTHVAQAVTIRKSSSTSPVWAFALTPRRVSISPEATLDGIYDHPVLIQMHDTPVSEDESSMSLFSATILFNMALVCHRMGLSHGDERSLVRASKLYLVVNELLRGSATTNSCQPAILLLSLAIHNLGHLQQDMNDYPAYNHSMMILWRMMPQIPEKDDPTLKHHLRRSLRLWQCTGPPMAAAA